MNETNIVAIEHVIKTEDGIDKRLGKAFPKASLKSLMFANYANNAIVPPKVFVYWKHKKKKPIPVYDMGNNEAGCCTIAQAAIYAMKRERIEQRRQIVVPKDEILKSYFNMTARLYGGGDTGAYMMDALNNWRNPDFSFRDNKGKGPYTIAAYTRLNHANLDEVKRAIITSDGKGIVIALALPLAWSNTLIWDIPETAQPVGMFSPYSWGGHAMCSALDYDEKWLYLDHTWNCPTGKISWRGFATYCDEAYSVIDDINSWKKIDRKVFNTSKLISHVNEVSDLKIKA